MPLLEIENLSVDFTTRKGIARAVDGISLSLKSGETLCVVGESGSGKSVLAMSVLGLLEKEGKIILIAPEEDTSSWKRMERRPEEIQKMYDKGYEMVMKYKDKILE